ncbi:hypothetical protein EJ07DRAFT_186172 [Lizonia empirigonia]|nr:hypothetical protein EJ07DRAFT_186172 [Lizonia empirigonia]
MPTTPPLSPSIAAEKRRRFRHWIATLSALSPTHTSALSPPSTPSDHRSSKRKRATSSAVFSCTMSTRTTSPKRVRRDSDTEVLPIHSISAAGATSSASLLTLNERNTFSPSGSQTSARNPRRANSPSRDNIAVLATACPPTITEPSSGLKEPPPTRVTDFMERLGEGLEGGWIPSQLRKLIEEDTDFGYQIIERRAWTESAAPDVLDLAVGSDVLVYTLQKVKDIWLNARTCQLKGRDENAWCMDVVERLVKLALKLEGRGKFWLQSVQSQAVNATFLSSVPDTACKSRLLDRKADFTLSFSHRPSPGFEDLYSRLRCAGNPIISHMTDAFTKTTALFSCVEVKPANGDLMEAQYQLSIWMAASLRKKMQLARCAGILDKSSLVEPCFAIVGHETHIYLAVHGFRRRG